MVGRRVLLGLVCLPILLAQFSKARAASVRRIGVLGIEEWDPKDADWVAFFEELKHRGYVQGNNLLLIERHSGMGASDLSRLDAMAHEFVAVPVDVILTTASAAVAAARRATTTIPIVMLAAGDPVASGFVSSLAHPGGNVTGNAFFGSELQLKQLEILIEGLGAPKRLAYVGHQYNRLVPRFTKVVQELQSAARTRGVELREVYVDSPTSLGKTLEGLVQERVEGALVEGTATVELGTAAIGAIVLKSRLPVIMTWPDYARAGVLFAYGVSMVDLSRKAAAYVARIFEGAKPSSLPVELPTQFEFLINMKAAKAIGLKIPSALLLRANEVIR